MMHILLYNGLFVQIIVDLAKKDSPQNKFSLCPYIKTL